MANDTGRADKETVHAASKSNLIKPEDIEQLPPERRDAYLKRLKAENEAGKASFKRSEEYLVVEGKKVLRKFSNAAGSEYTLYFFNRSKEKNKEIYAQILRQGGFKWADQETGKERFIPLKFVDGKPFKRGN